MLKLHVLQAENGDCLVLEFGSSNKKLILIDGGSTGVYDTSLKPFLQCLGRGTEFELVVLSHEDADHSTGLIDLMIELETYAYNEANSLKNEYNKPLIKIKEFWQNHLEDSLKPDYDLDSRLKTPVIVRTDYEKLRISFLSALINDEEFPNSDLAKRLESNQLDAVRSVRDGNILRTLATKKTLKIPINATFRNQPITIDVKNPTVNIDNLKLHIIGPSHVQLNRMVDKWKEWFKEHSNEVEFESTRAAAKDYSIPNLSSIMFLAEADCKKILFTGDGRYDHIIEGMEKRRLLNPDGTIKVDILKLPHHGSNRNVNKDFLTRIQADHYVISGNGKNGNPDFDTLNLIADVAKKQGRKIIIHVTYDDTDGIRKFRKKYLHNDQCELRALPFKTSKRYFTIDLS